MHTLNIIRKALDKVQMRWESLIVQRAFASRIAFVFAVTLFIFGILCIALAWTTAVQSGEVPQNLWDHTGNHGMWHGHTPQEFALERSYASLAGAGYSALVSAILKSSNNTWALVFSSFGVLFMSFVAHMYLTE